jgi:membrane dipeptidase
MILTVFWKGSITMTRRHLHGVAAAAVAAPLLNFGECRLFGARVKSYPIRVVDLVASSLVVDMLGLLTLDWKQLEDWQSLPNNFTSLDFELVRGVGLNVINPAVDLPDPEAHSQTLNWLRRWGKFVAEQPTRLQLILKLSDLLEAKRTQRLGVLLGLQNSDHFRTVADVPIFYKEGQRISQLTYNKGNRFGSGCTDQSNRGLSYAGAELIQAMNESGMAVDVSHTSERTTLDAIEASSKPLLITHSNCHALVPHPRCKSDAVIRAMAKKGGVMGITGVSAFLANGWRATLDDELDHFQHVSRLAGWEHVGIGSDAAVHTADVKPRSMSEGLRHPRRIFDLAEGLVRRGYSDSAIQGILGQNFYSALNGIMLE